VASLRLSEPGGGRPQQAGRQGTGPPHDGQPAARPRTAAEGLRQLAGGLTPRMLWRNHRLFTVLALISLVPRILAALAFRPALLTADSFLYMQGAMTGSLGVYRPSGYSLFLRILQPLPNVLLAVTTIQHLMGIAIAAIVYGLLRYWGLPAWGAALAAAPTLFDTRQIALESYILPDTLYTLVLLVTVALLLTRRTPRTWQCALAGLLMAYVSVLRGNGLPLAVVVAAFLLVRRVGWRAFTAGVVAFCAPFLVYVADYHAQHGSFNISSSDGIFLWSRTTSFANCAIIKPPPRLRPLCPNLETSMRTPAGPSWSVSSMLAQPGPDDYVWASDVWWRHDAHPGFNSYNNKLGKEFAEAAIRAQPLAYLRTVGRDIMLTFLANDRPQSQTTMSFTLQPHIAHLPSYYQRDMREYAGTTSNTHPVKPYEFFLFLYQLPVYFPGIVFFLVVIAGLVGVVRRRRDWGGPAALPWALAAVSIVVPAFVTQALYRYAMVAIPLACIAAGMAFIRRGAGPDLATAGYSARKAAVPAPGSGAGPAPGRGAAIPTPAPGSSGPAPAPGSAGQARRVQPPESAAEGPGRSPEAASGDPTAPSAGTALSPPPDAQAP